MCRGRDVKVDVDGVSCEATEGTEPLGKSGKARKTSKGVCVCVCVCGKGQEPRTSVKDLRLLSWANGPLKLAHNHRHVVIHSRSKEGWWGYRYRDGQLFVTTGCSSLTCSCPVGSFDPSSEHLAISTWRQMANQVFCLPSRQAPLG